MSENTDCILQWPSLRNFKNYFLVSGYKQLSVVDKNDILIFQKCSRMAAILIDFVSHIYFQLEFSDFVQNPPIIQRPLNIKKIKT